MQHKTQDHDCLYSDLHYNIIIILAHCHLNE